MLKTTPVKQYCIGGGGVFSYSKMVDLVDRQEAVDFPYLNFKGAFYVFLLMRHAK